MTKQKNVKTPQNSSDPFAAREATNYEHPVPSREYLLDFFEEVGEPMDYDTVCKQLELSSEEQLEGLRRRLIAMRRDGQLISNRRGVYGLAEHMDLVKGRVQGHKDGFGFLIPADASGDLFLGPGEMRKVFDGDTVLARMSGYDQRGRKEGTIVEILERRSKQMVGRYFEEHGLGLVVPDNRRIAHEILIPQGDSRGAEEGQFVVTEIISFPGQRQKPIGKVIEILGDTGTPGLEIEVALRSHDIPFEWPAAVEKQTGQFADDVEAGEDSRRIDIRELPFVTIDGEDAKDFDDAVFARPLKNGGYTLFVAIADVSHYVQVNSALDQEACNRGTSVYFPGHVIPMLPEKLSNGLCSLKPKVDRLTMVCEMTVSPDGELSDYRFYEGIIHSHARLTYTEVADMLAEEEGESAASRRERARSRQPDVVTHIDDLLGLFGILHAARFRDGALDFESTETRIVFGENKKIKEIIPVERNVAHRIVEECMLCANVATARFLEKSDLPVLYRIHEGPNPNKLEKLREYLSEIGLYLGGGDDPEPLDYHRLLTNIAGRPDRNLLQMMVIRSLMQAVYQPENLGHFGLGYAAYTHFTSPIRRYPDLLVHRAIRYLIRNKKSNRHVRRLQSSPVLKKVEIYPYSLANIVQLGESCSAAERRADAAGYDVMDWLKCEYMSSHIGDEYDGSIASVTSFGLFVELTDVFVEGLVHITELQNDYYHFDPVRHSLTGERSHKVYQLGDSVRVRLVRVSLDEKKIDLQMVGAQRTESPRRKAGDRKRVAKTKDKAKGKARGKAASGSNADKPAGEKSRKASAKKSAKKRKPRGAGKTADTNAGAKPAAKKKRAGKATAKKSAAAKAAKPARRSRKKKPS